MIFTSRIVSTFLSTSASQRLFHYHNRSASNLLIATKTRKSKVFLNLRGFLKNTASRARTCDLVHVKDALSQLSYDRIMREMGLEPTRPYSHKNLNLARLPIPTLPRM